MEIKEIIAQFESKRDDIATDLSYFDNTNKIESVNHLFNVSSASLNGVSRNILLSSATPAWHWALTLSGLRQLLPAARNTVVIACHLSRKFLITNSLVGGHIGLVKNGLR